jgi:transketolase
MWAGIIYSNLGGTHQSMEDIAVASALPNMTVLAPCDPEEMRLATEWCATRSEGPVYMRLGKSGELSLTNDAVDPFEIGKIRCLKKGADIAIMSYGITVEMAFNVAKYLENGDRSASVYSCHTIKPIDIEKVKEITSSYNQVIVIEEHVPHGGLGSRVKEIAWDTGVKCKIYHYSLKDEFIHFYGTHTQLLAQHGLEANRISDEILDCPTDDFS